MAITRLWFFNLRPPNSASDPAFLALWADVLELCALYTPAPACSSLQQSHLLLAMPPRRHHHFLLQSTADPTLLVLVSTYPSLALCREADTAYAARYMEQVSSRVRHAALRQMDTEGPEVVPALLASRAAAAANQDKPGQGCEDGGCITVTISSRDPLRLEVVRARLCDAGAGRGEPAMVPPPDEEISGPDLYHAPSLPGVESPDVYEAQPREARKWILISRTANAAPFGDGDEVFRLREVLSR